MPETIPTSPTAPHPARVAAIGTAVPDHCIDQDMAKSVARKIFGDALHDIERLLPLFDRSGVEHRHLCVPPDWFDHDHTFAESNDLYLAEILTLSTTAARRALDRAGVLPQDVGAVFFVSSTGVATPSVDARLVNELGLSADGVRRDATFGHGCAGGAGGLARAADWARTHPGVPVLLVAAELCSLAFQPRRLTKKNLVASALFADGAAAAVLSTDASGPAVIGDGSTVWPDTEDIMGWDIGEDGFDVVLSRRIPSMVRKHFNDSAQTTCEATGMDLDAIDHFIMHPGGAAVLDALAAVLPCEPDALDRSRDILRRYGNMSAPTVLFILERYLCELEADHHGIGLLSALGPGFCAEHVVLSWDGAT